MKEVEINNKLHPIEYGMLAYKKIEQVSGKAFPDINYESLSDQIAILYGGLLQGYRRKGRMCPYKNSDDLAVELPLGEEWIEIMKVVFEVLTDSLPSEGEGMPGAEK